MLYKRCSGCGKRIPNNINCKCQIDNTRERYKEYKARRKDKEEQAFYRSNTWIECKDSRRIDLVSIDWYEYYINGNIVEGYAMHHIHELKECKERALDKSNLIYLTQSNHIRIHKAYLKSEKEKNKMKRILFECLRKAKEEFGIG
jgi:5-methylcytosine-specific restriction enzyme A